MFSKKGDRPRPYCPSWYVALVSSKTIYKHNLDLDLGPYQQMFKSAKHVSATKAMAKIKREESVF